MNPIQWRPKLNALTKPHSYHPLVVPRGVIGYDELAARIALRNPIYNESLGKGYMLAMRQEIVALLAEGYQVSLPGFFTVIVSLLGRLSSVNAKLAALSESLRVRFSPAQSLVEDVSEIADTERLPITEKLPIISATEDALLQLPDVLDATGLLRIKGDDLFFDRQAAGCGCLLEGTRDGSVRQSRYAQISNSEILVMPDIPSQTQPWNNEYRLSVSTRYTENGTLRTGICQRMLRTALGVRIGSNSGLLSGAGTTALVILSGGTLTAEGARLRIQVILDVQDGDLRINLIDMQEGGAEGPKVQVSANGTYTLLGYSGADVTNLQITVNDYDSLLQMTRSPYGGRLVDILDVSAGS
jgi:hypothetical protein